jgi:hypothetical protein
MERGYSRKSVGYIVDDSQSSLMSFLEEDPLQNGDNGASILGIGFISLYIDMKLNEMD